MYNRCVNHVEIIRGIIGDFTPETAVVLGSGLGGFAKEINVEFTVDYKNISGFPVSTVAGHTGRFLFGTYAGKRIAAAEGRIHYYEGYTSAETAIPVRVFKLLGAKNVILTNAAGGINNGFCPGDIMLFEDHISLFAESPLSGKNIDEFGTRFPDMTAVYDAELKNVAVAAAMRLGIELKSGVYAQVKGPQYETPTEIRALERLGADAVGMSTVTEAIAARHAGMRVCALSVITNMAAGKNAGVLNHTEVIEISKRAGKVFCALLGEIIKNI
ncbi:MAG: purine-nucleoside phosphorylase [Clostridia bacterium]|nr:purine-nucleoside phosphorylase [Clostridia bacterium]